MNTHWELDTLTALNQATDEGQLFAAITRSARAIGFDYCAYGAKTPIPVSQPRIVLYNNYSPAWQERYRNNNYLAIDPTVQHAFKSCIPILWSEQRFAGARHMWEDAKAHGLRHGWAQACRDNTGLVGLLTLARSDEQISTGELEAHQGRMLWLVQLAHSAMSPRLAVKYLPEAQVYLTQRELEVLKWTAEGKTAAEVSLIMNISINTVNFHVSNFVRKLGANNKVQAVVKAALCGILN